MDRNLQIVRDLIARGHVRRIAEGLGLSTAAIYQWKRVPADRVVDLERLIEIPREELRPDLYERGTT